MPLLRMHYYSKGVNIYCAPTVDSRESWVPSMQHIAYEGRTYVLSACQYATKSHYPESWPDKSTDGTIIAGGSLIADPFGNILAGPLRGKEGVLTAEIDLDECIKGKFDLDVTGKLRCSGPYITNT
jgi:predicted amidohydrolase